MHGAALAQEAGSKLSEHPIRLEQRARIDGHIRVIGGMLVVGGEPDGASISHGKSLISTEMPSLRKAAMRRSWKSATDSGRNASSAPFPSVA
jgi:hypothetical protein